MKYCNNCLEPNTRVGIKFSANGNCPTCEYYSHFINNYDEKERIKILNNLLDRNKKIKKNEYFDCIIGVSGGKDSTRQALWIREKLKLKPLLVCCTYPPEQLTELGAENLSNLIKIKTSFLKNQTIQYLIILSQDE